jgi:hypothetical protein
MTSKEIKETWDMYLNGDHNEDPIYDNPESSNITLTITLGEQVENHAGMQKIGRKGYYCKTIKGIKIQ